MLRVLALLWLSLPMFTVGSGPAGDPSFTASTDTVGSYSVAGGNINNYTQQRKVFYAAGRWWVFHSDLSKHYWTSSTDGDTWASDQEVVTAAGAADSIGYAQNGASGTILHYVQSVGGSGDDVFYRRGTLGSDGNITWTAVEQTLRALSGGQYCHYPGVVVDSQGYAWVYYSYITSGPNYAVNIHQNTVDDGTWSEAGSFPAVLRNNSSQDPVIGAAALTSGKVFFAYTDDSAATPHKGTEWNGSSWESEETIGGVNTAYSAFSLGAVGDVIHMAYHATVGGQQDLYYSVRSAAGSWGADTTLTEDKTNVPGVTVSTQPDAVQIIWLNLDDDKVYGTVRDETDGAEITATAVLVDETTDDLTLYYTVNSVRQQTKANDPMITYLTASGPIKLRSLRMDRD